MPGKGTIDALFMMRMLQEKYDRKKKKLYMCFVDLEKAFDRVPREVIRWALRKKGVNEKFVEAVMRLYDGARTKVRVGSGLSEAFEVKSWIASGLGSVSVVLCGNGCCMRWGYRRVAI
jgi:hypothetical protein